MVPGNVLDHESARMASVAPLQGGRFPTSAPAAVLFPGQGSPPRDMRDRVERDLPVLAGMLYDEVGWDVFDEPETSQRRLQPALFAAIMCGWVRLSALVARGDLAWGPEADQPLAFAGHSLGEIAALVAADALDLEPATRLVHLRGAVMEHALENEAKGAMAALIGPGVHAFAERLSAERQVWIANDNSAVQIVLSGTESEMEGAMQEASAAGLRVVPMPMKGAGHSPLMAECVAPYREALQRVEFRPPSAPVYSCLTVRPFTDPRRELAESVTSTVRFREVLRELWARGARRFIDTGPGHTMAGLAHKTIEGAETLTVIDLEARAREAAGPPTAADLSTGPAQMRER